MKVNRIDLNFFKKKEPIETHEKVIFSNEFQNKIAFIKNNLSYYYEFMGLKIIKCLNTNKTIKDLLFKNIYDTYIKINDTYLRQKDVIVISPFTKIKDILNSKINGNIHNYLKEKDLFNISKDIENFVTEKLNKCDISFKNVIEYDLSKCDLINYVDVKEEFVSSENIIDILKILKTYDKKLLIIFNDIDYLDFDKIIEFLPFYNFLYFVNSLDDNYKQIENYEEFLIEYDYL